MCRFSLFVTLRNVIDKRGPSLANPRLSRCIICTYCTGISPSGDGLHVRLNDDGVLGRCRGRRPVHDDYIFGVSFEIYIFIFIIHVAL